MINYHIEIDNGSFYTQARRLWNYKNLLSTCILMLIKENSVFENCGMTKKKRHLKFENGHYLVVL